MYNVTRGEEPGEYFIEQTSQHFALGLTPLKHEYSYTGTLTAPNPELPAKLRVKFPLSKNNKLKEKNSNFEPTLIRIIRFFF